MKKSNLFLFVFVLLAISKETISQQNCCSQAVARTAMHIWKDTYTPEGNPAKWSYDQGVVLEGIAAVWKQTANAEYFNYIQKSMDYYVADDGTINTYKLADYNIDNIKNGTALLLLYRVTGKEKYWKAATTLREQLKGQPRTAEGGFWHKKIYPNQMWLDGLYMGEPFYAEHSMLAHDDTAFNDIAHQFMLIDKNARDPKTGLLYHGWDTSKKMAWANSKTGLSPNFWARAIGWYVMALVDALDYFPNDHPKRQELITILNNAVNGLEKVQDKKSGLWWDVLDKPEVKGNYFESSAASMFVYAIAKGVRLGYLPQSKLSIAQKGYKGILKTFIKNDNSQTNLEGTVKVSGLGGNPYRSGTVEYYLGEPVITNDGKGVGAFIKAAAEMEMIPTLKVGKGKTILLDYYFNHELMKDMTGKMIQYHYLWDEMNNGGYSMLGDIFNRYGVQTKALKSSVTVADLKDADIYFIIDPDTDKETKSPNYIQKENIDAIYDWVKAGGVLMMFANDSGNVEFEHFNQLANKFGIHFNEDRRNLVVGSDFPAGTFTIAPGNPVFKTPKKIYQKEICTLGLQSPAKPILTDNGDVIVAMSKVGKGTVFAMGDPWIYNEYVDGRKLPAELENYKGAEDMVRWLIKQTKK